MTMYVALCILSINSRMNGISLGLESCPNTLAHTISSSLYAPLPSNNALASNSQLSFKGLQHTIYLFDLPHINTNEANEVRTTIISIILLPQMVFVLLPHGCWNLFKFFSCAFQVCKDGPR